MIFDCDELFIDIYFEFFQEFVVVQCKNSFGIGGNGYSV